MTGLATLSRTDRVELEKAREKLPEKKLEELEKKTEELEEQIYRITNWPDDLMHGFLSTLVEKHKRDLAPMLLFALKRAQYTGEEGNERIVKQFLEGWLKKQK
ncbi:hypothetical protein PsorP6_017263 [Peronosclerospora sorghi]|uniref:Uncharacterized protein n=1 Tax=Peronosclerospora sorghi TaxID=230839 RepID=A0ACC0WM43_9STRA|nr:hypothetical protein PsorP6_017263 [Peronosclerospora sorghi]